MLESSELPIQLVFVESGSQAQVGREKGQGVSKLCEYGPHPPVVRSSGLIQLSYSTKP